MSAQGMNCMCGMGKRFNRAIQDRRRYENKVEIEIFDANAKRKLQYLVILGEVDGKVDAREKSKARDVTCGQSARR